MMQIKGFDTVETMELPDDWQASDERSTEILQMKSWHPQAHPDVEITFFKRRAGVPPKAMAAFTTLLEKPPHRLDQGGPELLSITDALGNVGNNQWSNRATGDYKSAFRLLNTETFAIDKKVVLKVSGAFMEPVARQAKTEFCGIFIPIGNDTNEIEELYLQVPSQYGYMLLERYSNVFLATLQTICWSK